MPWPGRTVAKVLSINKQQSGPFWCKSSMCNGAKMMIYKPWKKIGEVGNKPKYQRDRLGSKEVVSMGLVEGSGRQEKTKPLLLLLV